MNKSDPLHVCRVCGYDNGEPLWEEGKFPLYLICDCCGAESGVDDYEKEVIKTYREEWIKSGMKWFEPKKKPDHWNLQEQMKGISKEFL